LTDVKARIAHGTALSKRSGALIALAQIVAQSANAQIPSSSAMPIPQRDQQASIEGAIEIRRLAKCILGKEPNRPLVLLTTLPGSTDEKRLVDSFRSRMQYCMTGYRPGIVFYAKDLRAAFAESLYVGAYGADPDFSTIPHEEVPLPSTWLKKKYTSAEAAMLVAHDMARCLVARNPGVSAELVRSQPASVDERAAIKKIVPLIGPCLRNGSKISLVPASLRSVVSQEYYRSVMQWAPPGPASAGGQN
jgi:hypothetical protein